jgi:phytoene/squalene synthetase
MTRLALYNRVAERSASLVIREYSTSFGLASRILSAGSRQHIDNVYALVRLADEIVDGVAVEAGLSTGEAGQQLDALEADTYRAMETGYSTNLIVHAFALTARDVSIHKDIVEPFFTSMRMDLSDRVYTQESFDAYVYGSAEVVGLMCLAVFIRDDKPDTETARTLYSGARALGAAFQKVNFLRDIKSDFEERGRVYFPGVDFNRFDTSVKSLIEEDIQKDFDDSLIGIAGLPDGAKLGVKVAYLYYQKLFDKIKKLPPETITQERVRIPNARKLSLLFGSYVENKLGFS